MRHRPASSRGLGPVAMLALVLALLVLGVGGTFGTLLVLGHLPNPWKQAQPLVAEKAPQAAEPVVDRTGQVPCVVLGRPLKSYDRITRDDLVNPKSGELAVIWVPEKAADESWLRDPGQILGRVVARDKAAGYVLTERDLLPKGTREGISGGVPPGKMALVVKAEKVRGLHVLRAGDAFDLLAAVPIDLKKELPQLQLGLGNDALAERDQVMSHLQKRATIEVLVEHGVMVTPGSMTDDITIAVAPAEIVPLTKSLQLEHGVFCVARSGQTPAPGMSTPAPAATVRIPADESPLKDLAIIEKVSPKGREVEVFVTSYPAGKEAPQSNEQRQN